MYWIKRGIKMGLVLSLVGGCTAITTKPVQDEPSSGAYAEREVQREDTKRTQEGVKRPKKQLAAYRRAKLREQQEFEAKMSGLEQSTQLISAQISKLQASSIEGGKVELQKRIEQLSANITQLRQQTIAPNEVKEEHQEKAAQLESQIKSLMDMLGLSQ